MFFDGLKSALYLNDKQIVIVLCGIVYLVFVTVELHSQLYSCTVILQELKSEHGGYGLSWVGV